MWAQRVAIRGHGTAVACSEQKLVHVRTQTVALRAHRRIPRISDIQGGAP